MKQHPILFSTPMVQAILQGNKSQTRRTKNLDDINTNSDDYVFQGFSNGNPKNAFGALFMHKSGLYVFIPCPYGEVGDVLWVRETWFKTTEFLGTKGRFYYKAEVESKPNAINFKYRPSIHMPKEACRLFLQITKIRVERLNSISSHDAKWEGMEENGEPFVERFIALWDKINGDKHPWNSNPWVWVIEFKQIEKPC